MFRYFRSHWPMLVNGTIAAARNAVRRRLCQAGSPDGPVESLPPWITGERRTRAKGIQPGSGQLPPRPERSGLVLSRDLNSTACSMRNRNAEWGVKALLALFEVLLDPLR